jgi:hypothetical protein
MHSIPRLYRTSHERVMGAVAVINAEMGDTNALFPTADQFEKLMSGKRPAYRRDVMMLEGASIMMQDLMKVHDLTIKSTASLDATSSSSGEEQKIEFFWWGARVYIISNFAEVIANALIAGATVSAIFGIISSMLPGLAPVAIVCAIATAVLALGAAAIKYANSQKQGVYFEVCLIPPYVWVFGQGSPRIGPVFPT